MLKEIFEQPWCRPSKTPSAPARRGRSHGQVRRAQRRSPQLRRIDRIVPTACGRAGNGRTGRHGRHLLEEFTRIPTEVEYASERATAIRPGDRYPWSSPSPRAATWPTRRPSAGVRVQAVRLSHAGDLQCGRFDDYPRGGCNYLQCRLEIGVVLTKAFTAQVIPHAVVPLFGPHAAPVVPGRQADDRASQGHACPGRAARCNATKPGWEVAEKYYRANNFLYLRRLHNFPVLLEGTSRGAWRDQATSMPRHSAAK